MIGIIEDKDTINFEVRNKGSGAKELTVAYELSGCSPVLGVSFVFGGMRSLPPPRQNEWSSLVSLRNLFEIHAVHTAGTTALYNYKAIGSSIGFML